MPRRRAVPKTYELTELVTSQAGAVSRVQAMDAGMSPGQIQSQLLGHRWQTSGFDGVYVTFTGPMSYLTRCWAALLYAGDDAILGLSTAAWIWKLTDEPPPLVHVMIPIHRRVVGQRGLAVNHRLHLAQRRHPAKSPPVTRIEDTVLDLTDGSAEAAVVVDVVIRVCQKRLTTPARLIESMCRRKKLRWRRLLLDVLADVRHGVQSPLERSYLRDVERAHGLPQGVRNRADGVAGSRRYRDVRYRRYRLVVELDGRAAHPTDARDIDDIRDNALIEDEGVRTLRYGWKAVSSRPCDTAAQVGRLLSQAGWTGHVKRCGSGCSATP